MKSSWFALTAAAVMAIGMTGAVAEPTNQPPVPAGAVPVASPDHPYVWRKVNDHFYVIAEIHQPFPREKVTNPPHTQQIGLIIGTKKAAVIDTGLGLADLRKYVEQFTKLPIIVINTHEHLDHVGANQLFDMSYISKEDEATMLSSTRKDRLAAYGQFMEGNTAMLDFAAKSMVDDKKFKYGFVKDGDKIDLGGIQLDIIGFPGHTPGSIAIRDAQDGIDFTGDSMLFRVLLNDREKLKLWLASVETFAARTPATDTIINGH